MQSYSQASTDQNRSTPSWIALRSLAITWWTIRVPLVTLLTILKPVVAFVLSALALLGVLTTIFFELVGPPGFPAVTMLAISVGCGMALSGYRAVLRVLSN